MDEPTPVEAEVVVDLGRQELLMILREVQDLSARGSR